MVALIKVGYKTNYMNQFTALTRPTKLIDQINKTLLLKFDCTMRKQNIHYETLNLELNGHCFIFV